MAEAPVHRRLAAILMADVVGYSRLMEADEEGTLAALKERRRAIVDPLVREHAGQVVKVMGDGLMIAFASAVDALACAIAVQQRMAETNESLPEARRLIMRIGINLGDVIADDDDLYGDGVNVAARLEAMAAPGGISLSGSVRDAVAGKLDAAFEDLGEVKVKNISRPLRVWRIGESGGSAPAARAAEWSHSKPQIAVLPFVNMSGEAEQEFFVDGLTEDIITALSRSATLSVIARTSTFAYKGKAADIKAIARELDAGYVLEGSVRKAGDRVRVTAQLIDGDSGAHLWAEKFDGTVEDIFDIQDRITGSVASATHTQIFSTAHRVQTALSRLASPAYRLALEANGFLFEMTPGSFERASELVEQALAIDPSLAYAYRIRANAFIVKVATGLLPHSAENLERGIALAAEAVRRAPDDEFCHWLMALALAEAGRLEEAVAECDIGLQINPNAGMIMGDKGDYLVMLGQLDEGIACCEQAIAFNPRDPIRYWWENSIATAHLLAGRYEDALSVARKVALRKPDHVRAAIVWAAASAALDRQEDAKQAIAHCLGRFPGLTLATVMPHYMPTLRRPEDRERLLDGLRNAGLPAASNHD